MMEPAGNSLYNALQLTAEKRFSRGFTILGNYTFAKTIDNNVGSANKGNGTNVTNPYNQHFDRGPADYNLKHVFNFSGVFQSPIFSRNVLRMVASRWQLSPIVKIKSGQYFTVTSGTDVALTATAGQTANLVPGVSPYAANKSVDGWLNKEAFAVPAPGTYGNLGYNNLLGPGAFQFDVSLARTFQIPGRESQTLQFRAEAFNLPNHLNPSPPVSSLNSSDFGRILKNGIAFQNGLAAGDPRILQFALKYVF